MTIKLKNGLWTVASLPESDSPDAAYTVEPLPQSEVATRLGKYLESVKRSTRAVDDLTTPLSKATAKNCFTALQRLAMLPNADRAIIAELVELTQSLVRKLARSLDLDRDRLLASDPDEWQIAFDGLPGGQYGAIPAGVAAFAHSLVMPTPKPVVATPAIEKPSPIKPDGFYDPSTIWLDGKTAEVKPMAYALLKYMWNRESAQIDHVSDSMWGPIDDQTAGAFANHLTWANIALSQLDSTWSLKKRGEFLKKFPHKKFTKKSFGDVKKS